MSAWSALLQLAASGWLAGLGRACWAGSLGLLLAAAVCRLLGGLAPSVRCWLWRAAYLKLLSALLWTTPLVLAVLPPVNSPSGLLYSSESTVSTSAPDTGAEGNVPERSSSGNSPGFSVLPLWVTPALLLVWLAGAGLGTFALTRRWQKLVRLKRQAQPLTAREVPLAYAELGRKLRLRRLPPLFISPEAPAPLLFGPVSPVILLPERLLHECTTAEVRLILAHELVHLRRGDLWWGWLPLLGRLLFFFHPLLWLAEREWREAQEMACDALALQSAGASVSDYGGTLMKVVEYCAPRRSADLPALAVLESFQALRRRLLALPNGARPRPLIWRGVGTMVMGAALLGLLPCRLAARPAAAPPRTISVTARNMTLREILAQGFAKSGRQYTVAPDVPDVVMTLGFRNVTLDEFLQKLIKFATVDGVYMKLSRRGNLYHLTLAEDAARRSRPDAQAPGPDRTLRLTANVNQVPLRNVLKQLFSSARGQQWEVASNVPDVLVSLEIEDVDLETAVKALVEEAARQVPGITLAHKGDRYVIRR